MRGPQTDRVLLAPRPKPPSEPSSYHHLSRQLTASDPVVTQIFDRPGNSSAPIMGEATLPTAVPIDQEHSTANSRGLIIQLEFDCFDLDPTDKAP